MLTTLRSRVDGVDERSAGRRHGALGASRSPPRTERSFHFGISPAAIPERADTLCPGMQQPKRFSRLKARIRRILAYLGALAALAILLVGVALVGVAGPTLAASPGPPFPIRLPPSHPMSSTRRTRSARLPVPTPSS